MPPVCSSVLRSSLSQRGVQPRGSQRSDTAMSAWAQACTSDCQSILVVERVARSRYSRPSRLDDRDAGIAGTGAERRGIQQARLLIETGSLADEIAHEVAASVTQHHRSSVHRHDCEVAAVAGEEQVRRGRQEGSRCPDGEWDETEQTWPGRPEAQPQRAGHHQPKSPDRHRSAVLRLLLWHWPRCEPATAARRRHGPPPTKAAPRSRQDP